MNEPIFTILFGSGHTIDIADDGVVSGTHPDLQGGQFAVMNRISSRIAGHKDDASVTEQDLAFIAWAKAHRGSYIREFERLQRRDAKKAKNAENAENAEKSSHG
jgi:hypothetical protein